MLGVRPVATSRCDPSSRSPSSRTTGRRPSRSTRAISHMVAQLHAFISQALHDDGGELGIVLGEEVEASSTVTRDAQPPVRLRHLEADRPAADHDEMRRQGAVGEHRLVGEIRHLGETGNRRRRSAREPVASTMRRRRMRWPPACSSSRPMKRASSLSTRTPSFSKRSTESLRRDGGDHALRRDPSTLAKSTSRLDRRDAEGRAACAAPAPPWPRRSAPSTARSRS